MTTTDLLTALREEIKAEVMREVLSSVQDRTLDGVWWNMKELEERIGFKQDWIKQHILFHPHWRKYIDAEKGGFVYYPESGSKWKFHAKRMVQFLDENFADVMTRHTLLK